MDKKTLESKLSEAQARFDELVKQEEALKGQASELNKNFAQVREEMVRVQGDYRTLQGLIDETKEEKKK